jgi:hypothetical protein
MHYVVNCEDTITELRRFIEGKRYPVDYTPEQRINIEKMILEFKKFK